MSIALILVINQIHLILFSFPCSWKVSDEIFTNSPMISEKNQVKILICDLVPRSRNDPDLEYLQSK